MINNLNIKKNIKTSVVLLLTNTWSFAHGYALEMSWSDLEFHISSHKQSFDFLNPLNYWNCCKPSDALKPDQTLKKNLTHLSEHNKKLIPKVVQPYLDDKPEVKGSLSIEPTLQIDNLNYPPVPGTETIQNMLEKLCFYKNSVYYWPNLRYLYNHTNDLEKLELIPHLKYIAKNPKHIGVWHANMYLKEIYDKMQIEPGKSHHYYLSLYTSIGALTEQPNPYILKACIWLLNNQTPYCKVNPYYCLCDLANNNAHPLQWRAIEVLQQHYEPHNYIFFLYNISLDPHHPDKNLAHLKLKELKIIDNGYIPNPNDFSIFPL